MSADSPLRSQDGTELLCASCAQSPAVMACEACHDHLCEECWDNDDSSALCGACDVDPEEDDE